MFTLISILMRAVSLSSKLLVQPIECDVFGDGVVRDEEILPRFATVGFCVVAGVLTPFFSHCLFCKDIRGGHFALFLLFDHADQVLCFSHKVELIFEMIGSGADKRFELPFT